MIRAVLLDIEGTTTDIGFVQNVLFPYARDRIAEFVSARAIEPGVAFCLSQVAETLREEEGREPARDEIVTALLRWMESDRKHPALKSLQGMIWRHGYEEKSYKAHLYDDVVPALQSWRNHGVKLAIFSSGSVQAQKLLFRYTVAGDVTSLLSAYFDLATGAKREPESYRKIAAALEIHPEEILFLSDTPEELDAAGEAGLKVLQILRAGTRESGRHLTARDLGEVDLADFKAD